MIAKLLVFVYVLFSAFMCYHGATRPRHELSKPLLFSNIAYLLCMTILLPFLVKGSEKPTTDASSREGGELADAEDDLPEWLIPKRRKRTVWIKNLYVKSLFPDLLFLGSLFEALDGLSIRTKKLMSFMFYIVAISFVVGGLVVGVPALLADPVSALALLGSAILWAISLFALGGLIMIFMLGLKIGIKIMVMPFAIVLFAILELTALLGTLVFLVAALLLLLHWLGMHLQLLLIVMLGLIQYILLSFAPLSTALTLAFARKAHAPKDLISFARHLVPPGVRDEFEWSMDNVYAYIILEKHIDIWEISAFQRLSIALLTGWTILSATSARLNEIIVPRLLGRLVWLWRLTIR